MYVSKRVINSIYVALDAMAMMPEEPDGLIASEVLIDFKRKAIKENSRRKPRKRKERTFPEYEDNRTAEEREAGSYTVSGYGDIAK